ncbi:MAG: amidase family protein [Lysobacterales bacterium]
MSNICIGARKALAPLLMGFVAVFALSSCGQDEPAASNDSSNPTPSSSPAGEQVQATGKQYQRDDAITAMTAIELQTAIAAGELKAAAVTSAFLERIYRLDAGKDGFNAVIEVNPQAMDIAGALDQQLAAGGAAGPLFGVPVLIKANIDTADEMATSAGSIALADHHATTDAYVVSLIRAAGGVVLGKTNLSEWANFRSTQSSSGWSSLGGQTKNAWNKSANPCGSSSGSAVAVAIRLAPLALGTETNGSITCPAGANGVFGLKPTMGRVSRSGVIPIANSMDMVGPMARTAADLALLMRVIDGSDPQDRATTIRFKKYGILPPSFNGSLKGMRIGVWRTYTGADTNPKVNALLDEMVAQLTALGAEITDPIEMTVGDLGSQAYKIMLYEFREGINAYLEGISDPAAPKSLSDLIAFNKNNASRVLAHFNQDILEAAQAVNWTPAEYGQALTKVRGAANLQIELALRKHGLTQLISVSNGPAWSTDLENGDDFSIASSTLPAISGHPHLTVPMGLVDGLPIGLSIINARSNEFRGLNLAAAVEETRGALIPPLD